MLLRDLRRGKDADLNAVEAVIADLSPDVLLLTDVDFDHGLAALSALRDRLRERNIQVRTVSAVTRSGLRELTFAIAREIQALRARQREEGEAPAP